MLDKVTQPKKIKYDRDIQYAFASSRLATNWTNHNMAWSDFMQKLSSTVRTKESLLDYNKMSKSEQANVKDVGGFVGGYLKEGKRRAWTKPTKRRTYYCMVWSNVVLRIISTSKR
ncbi:hypothetical protein JPSP51_13830 [Staphylococcus pseudintermedius]